MAGYHMFQPDKPGSPVCKCGTMDVNECHIPLDERKLGQSVYTETPIQTANRLALEHQRIALKSQAAFEQSFVTKDSGERKQFESGMVRDTTAGKISWHKTAEGPMQRRWAELLTRGAVKYPDPKPGVGNWTLADGDAELARFKESAYRHFMQWFLNTDQDEDHAAAVFFNINGAEYVKEKKNGKA